MIVNKILNSSCKMEHLTLAVAAMECSKQLMSPLTKVVDCVCLFYVPLTCLIMKHSCSFFKIKLVSIILFKM